MRSASKAAAILGLGILSTACSDDDSGPEAPRPACPAGVACIAFAATDSETKIQDGFATAPAGTLILFGEGTFKLTNTLAIASSDVIVRGAGRDKTTLDFSGQKAGSEGLLAENGKNLTFEAFTVVDTRGNGIKTLGADGVTFRNTGVRWTAEDGTSHGPYGLYPVQSKRVLIEDCVVSGASDAGVYVGQSDGVIVRRNEVMNNVAGIEIENTWNADVFENNTHDNTGGILVFDLPGLPQKGGHTVRVHDNQIVSNNTNNFAPEGNIVGLVPRGTGMLVMANADVEVYANVIRDNKTASIAVTSYLIAEKPIEDPAYYPYPSRVHVHDNTFAGGGDAPDPRSRLGLVLATAMSAFPNGLVPAVLYDGIVDEKKPAGPNPQEICVRGAPTFANLHLDKLDANAPNLKAIVTLDAQPYDCTLPAVPAPTFQP